MEFSWNPGTKCTEKPQSSISTHLFSDVPFIFLQNACSIFSDLYIPPCVGKHVSIYGVHVRKCIESMHFYSCPSSLLKTPGTIFWKPVSPKGQEKRGGGNYDLLEKFNQKRWRWLGTLVFLYFVWFIIFLNVMALLFCE